MSWALPSAAGWVRHWQVRDWVVPVSLLNHQLVILNSLEPRLPIWRAEAVSQGFGCSDDETERGECSKLSSEVSHVVAPAVGAPKVLREATALRVALQWLSWCHRAELCRALPPTSLLGSFWLWEGEKLGDRTESWSVVTSPFLPVGFHGILSCLWVHEACEWRCTLIRKWASLLPSGTAASKFLWTDVFPFFLSTPDY